jgi:hypothetical protein
VSAALIGRDNKNAATVSERSKCGGQKFIQLLRREIRIDTSRSATETHAANPASLGTIVERRCLEQLPGESMSPRLGFRMKWSVGFFKWGRGLDCAAKFVIVECRHVRFVPPEIPGLKIETWGTRNWFENKGSETCWSKDFGENRALRMRKKF